MLHYKESLPWIKSDKTLIRRSGRGHPLDAYALRLNDGTWQLSKNQNFQRDFKIVFSNNGVITETVSTLHNGYKEEHHLEAAIEFGNEHGRWPFEHTYTIQIEDPTVNEAKQMCQMLDNPKYKLHKMLTKIQLYSLNKDIEKEELSIGTCQEVNRIFKYVHKHHQQS